MAAEANSPQDKLTWLKLAAGWLSLIESLGGREAEP
jgi:hypothetical protein